MAISRVRRRSATFLERTSRRWTFASRSQGDWRMSRSDLLRVVCTTALVLGTAACGSRLDLGGGELPIGSGGGGSTGDVVPAPSAGGGSSGVPVGTEDAGNAPNAIADARAALFGRRRLRLAPGLRAGPLPRDVQSQRRLRTRAPASSVPYPIRCCSGLPIALRSSVGSGFSILHARGRARRRPARALPMPGLSVGSSRWLRQRWGAQRWGAHVLDDLLRCSPQHAATGLRSRRLQLHLQRQPRLSLRYDRSTHHVQLLLQLMKSQLLPFHGVTTMKANDPSRTATFELSKIRLWQGAAVLFASLAFSCAGKTNDTQSPLSTCGSSCGVEQVSHRARRRVTS